MKHKRFLIFFFVVLLTLVACTSAPTQTSELSAQGPESQANQEAETPQVTETIQNRALTPRPLSPKNIEINPYMAQTENSVHVDNYNSDATDFVLPIGINSEVTTSFETESTNAPPSVFYDSKGNAYAPYLSTGIAVRDLDSEVIETLGSFYPATDDDHGYAIQQSYSFIDNGDNLVAPTTDNRVIMLKTMDDAGMVLETFEKILDINVGEIAQQVLGKTFEQTLMSITYDYEGNLWFSTGGFRIYPDRQESGFVGYISRLAIEETLSGGSPDLLSEVHFYELELGEGAENGIASSPYGAVILTNKACYLLAANEQVEPIWRVAYESNGENSGEEGDATMGGGLSWGSGTSPALSNEYVFFADNTDPIQLYAVELSTGEVLGTLPVIDDLPEDMPVSIDNAAIAYEEENGDVAVILCNWFGASNPGLSDPDSDSSIQSYDNLYNPDWILNGNSAIMPGIERADLVDVNGEKELVSVWSRDDLRSTAMFKLSTATGYLYGYAQDINTGMWQYVILDYETGETVYTYDISTLSGYNNMAVGMFSSPVSNALYCPTGNFELLRMQDRFAYLTNSPYRELDLDDMGRERIFTQDFVASGGEGTVASWLHHVMAYNASDRDGATAFTLRINGLQGNAQDFSLYARDENGAYKELSSDRWSFASEEEVLEEGTVYEVNIIIEDDGEFDTAEEEGFVGISVLLSHP